MRKTEDKKIPLTSQISFYKNLLEEMRVGIVVTDNNGTIIYSNNYWHKVSPIDPSDKVGKHITEVIPNSRLPIVAKTGKAEINHPHKIGDKGYLVQRIPIKREGQVEAVLGLILFDSADMASRMAEKLVSLESKLQLYEKELFTLRSTRYTIDSIVGKSKAILRCKEQVFKAASTNLPVLISGESGTGKELFAQAIHNASARRAFPFVRLNCCAIPKDLIESELFGYVQGAFTGASPKGKPGKFELAHHGSIFLDEIGDLPMEMQPKILRVLEEKEFEHLGGNTPIKTDFRLIAATNRNLGEMMTSNLFRKDLFYRLNVIPLSIPPLRERREDIAPTARHLIGQISQDIGLPEAKLDPKTEEVLTRYDWPGNVRELWNLLAMVLSSIEHDTIYVHHLPSHINASSISAQPSNPKSIHSARATAEAKMILNALESTRYNKTLAAKMLGIHRSALYKKMKRYNLPLGQSPKKL